MSVYGVDVWVSTVTRIYVEAPTEGDAKFRAGEFSLSDIEDALNGAATRHDNYLVRAVSVGYDREEKFCGRVVDPDGLGDLLDNDETPEFA